MTARLGQYNKDDGIKFIRNSIKLDNLTKHSIKTPSVTEFHMVKVVGYY